MRLQSATILASSGALLALATLLGAFGAHVLRATLAPNELSVYLSAERYQYFHSLGLLGVGLSARSMDGALLRWSAALLLAGIVLFCGSLYLLAFGAPHAFGVATPVGGLLLIAGWVLYACAMWRARTS
ncbi:MAG TPA: DUF423 domain-containing protein [Steroidobacteraceae bacterium]|jgi:uncharacterized membrane protein YgdD (TMEM256/DUF423 family)